LQQKSSDKNNPKRDNLIERFKFKHVQRIMTSRKGQRIIRFETIITNQTVYVGEDEYKVAYADFNQL
jgi:hypothetical protein